jgi:hypothetical protein
MKTKSRWHAVGIVCPKGSCAAAMAFLEKRFIPAEAPRLPLPECGQPQSCRCTYRHFDDRRGKPRRAVESGRLSRVTTPAVERRVKRGRRLPDT